MSAPPTSPADITPLGEVLGSFAAGMQEAQRAIDLFSLRAALMRGDEADAEGAVGVDFDGERVSVLALGLSPTFLQIAEATLELKLSVQFQRVDSEAASRGELGARAHSRRDAELWVCAVDGRHAGVYQYSAEGASWTRTRLAPAPAPAPLLALIERLAAAEEDAA